MIFVYITNPNLKTARNVARKLLEKRLIACANIFPVESFYWWKDKVENSKEFVLIAKSLEKNFRKIVEEVRKVHPYEIPCICKLKVEANKEFKGWVKKEVR